MKVLGRIFLNSRKERRKDGKKERRKDVKTERRSFFVSCRRTYVLKNQFEQYFEIIIVVQNQLIQSANILLLPSKCEIVLLPFKNGNFSNIAIAILDISLLLLVKLSLLILFAYFLVSVLCFFCGSKVIALSTIVIAIVVALSRY